MERCKNLTFSFIPQLSFTGDSDTTLWNTFIYGMESKTISRIYWKLNFIDFIV